jgi:hypothetical protein
MVCGFWYYDKWADLLRVQLKHYVLNDMFADGQNENVCIA